MESLETLSINAKQEENLSKSEFDFPKKKQLTPEQMGRLKRGEIKVIVNYSRFNMKKVEKLWVYGISIKGTEENPENNYISFLIRNLKETEEFNLEMEQYFNYYMIRGNQIYGEPFYPEKEPPIYPAIYVKEGEGGKVTLITQEQYDEIKKREDKKGIVIFYVTVSRKFSLSEASSDTVKKVNAHLLKNYINLVIAEKMANCSYVRSFESRRTLYYKNVDKPFYGHRILIENKPFYYNYGYQIVCSIVQGQVLLVKMIPKFRLLRDETYGDYLQSLRSRFPRIEADEIFIQNCIGRKGVKVYDQRPVRIDGVEVLNPQEVFIETKTKGNIPLTVYYETRYNIKIQPGSQFMFFKNERERNYQTGEIKEVKLYFFPHLLYICGLMENETVNVKTLIMPPQDRLNGILGLNNELNQSSQLVKNDPKSKILNSAVDFRPVTMEAILIQQPQLVFKYAVVDPDDRGFFDPVKEPNENIPMKNWLVILIDCEKTEGNEIFKRMKAAAESLNITIPVPRVSSFPLDKLIIKGDENNFRYDLDNFLFETGEIENSKGENKCEIVYYFISDRLKNQYNIIKDCHYNSELKVNSQVVVKEKALKSKVSYFTNILFQNWSKRDFSVYKIKMDPKLNSTISISYCVAFNKTQGRNLTTVGFTYDKYFQSMIFYEDYDEIQGGNFSATIIQRLVTKGLTDTIKDFNAYWKNKKTVENIIIYREGANESQREMLMKFEISALLNGIQEVCNKFKINQPKTCFIFVNKRCDTKIFQIDQQVDNKSIEGLEHFQKYELKAEEFGVTNIPVGTLIIDKITQEDIWEFYLNSAYSAQGTNNPTHYIVGHDSTDFSAEIIYKLTYYLTYLYTNTSKSIRLPAPLHRVIRRNQHIIKNLQSLPGKAFRKIDISL